LNSNFKLKINNSEMDLPKDLKLTLKKHRDMRYGENPHQKSAFYMEGNEPGFTQIAGIELSHNNLGDANHAWRLVCDFESPTVAIIKHGNPSGICSRSDPAEAFKLAYDADRVSAFGGIVAVNCEPTLEMVAAMQGIFFELIVAPEFGKDVLEALKKKSSKLRIVMAEKPPAQLEFTRAFGGYLVQTSDTAKESPLQWQVVSGEKPDKKTYADLEFAWKVVKHVKSNAIVIVGDLNMLGMGTGQPNRVNSVKLALDQAGSKARGAVLASDAFFPFEDSVELAAKAGISTIIQPGGSINDERVIDDAKKHDITMVFTGVRHFKH
jgi:phosphoribosylaminoimidazolecarboxamide formyltransferase/IMP cyclohydrolase